MIIQIKEYATRIDVYLTKILGEKSRSSIVQSIDVEPRVPQGCVFPDAESLGIICAYSLAITVPF